ncbi:ribonuclease P protein component [Segniliparus rugosus ATCC BAA-974]|uniref:Ribonuclease P protein component n=2 Tax=Segniliparus rugosus TaxID=286804 RepID=E5XV93_SEGRC|nr:ribonuclease P protein component [Segniliparus rugosus ATCC BAA-974]
MVVHLLTRDFGDAQGRVVAAPCASKAGLIVGKQVGGSVTRKKVSRKLRSALRSVLPELPPSSLLVVRALPGSAQTQVAEFEGQLRSALRKLAPTAVVVGGSSEQADTSGKEGPR